MLYVTTRNNRDAHTPQRAFRENQGPEGGLYLPMRAPVISQEILDSLGKRSFSQNTAMVLNLLCKTQLTSWDVEFAIGRHPVRLEPLGRRELLAELWRNPQWRYEALVEKLTQLVLGEEVLPGNWARIAVGIAVLFGLFGQLQEMGIQGADVSLPAGDLSLGMSAWYARAWGLPIGSIVFSCQEDKFLWELLCQGQLRTAGETLPVDLERLIYAWGGSREVAHYLECCWQEAAYIPTETMLARLKTGMQVSVVSPQRVKETIPGVWRSHGRVLSPAGALAYAGLLDYRARTGETRWALVLEQTPPGKEEAFVTDALGMTQEEWKRRL